MDKQQRLTMARKRAEERRQRYGEDGMQKTVLDRERLVHELEVHQIELEMQNEELGAARHELERSLELYTQLFDFAPVGYVTVDQCGRIKAVNHVGAKILGRSRIVLLENHLTTFVNSNSLSDLRTLLEGAAAGDKRKTCTVEVRQQPGSSPVTARITGSRLAPQQALTMLTLEDISESIQQERQLRATEQALRLASERKDQFLAVLSHELRNPLTPMNGSLSILGEPEARPEQVRRACAILRRQIDHLTRLVEDLLDVSRIGRGKIELRREIVDLAALVRTTVEDHRDQCESAEISLTTAPLPEPIWVNVDSTRVTQALSNLLGNAAKFTPRGGRVRVKIDRAGEWVTVRVTDSGVGVDPVLANSLFEPFMQGPQSSDRREGGLGLGLAMVKGLVELHGGAVAIKSDGVGRGSELSMTFQASAPPSQVALPRESVPIAPLRVLLIDDNADAVEVLKEALMLRGHCVTSALDGAEGVATARSFRPDVIVCDIGLPRMDGYSVARALRADPDLCGVRLIALSGYAQPQDLKRSQDAGFDTHVAKPPRLEVLERVLH